MKILIVTDNLYPELGGSYKAITDTHKILSENTNFKTRVVFNRNASFKKKLDLLFLIKNFDIIHYFGGWSLFHIKVMILSFIFKKKIIITPMGIFENWSLNQKKIKKKIALNIYQKFFLNNVNVIHVTSEIEKLSLEKISSNKNIIVIPHGIDKKNMQKNKIFKGTKKKALFFSRLHKKKGINELIDCWININHKEWELDIYGPDYGNYKKIIQEKIKNTDSISLFDPVYNNKDEVFQNYDLFILPSKSENFGYSVLEAMLNGIPVLTTNTTPWTMLEEKNVGWIIDGNLKNLETVLEKVLNSSQKEFENKSINSINFSKKFYWDNLIDKYLYMYQKI